MRKNVRNDKVLRAIAIGLATMIAVTSTPITTYAEGTEQQEQQQDSQQQDSQQQEPQQQEPAQQTTASVPASQIGIMVVNLLPIDNAQSAVTAAENKPVVITDKDGNEINTSTKLKEEDAEGNNVQDYLQNSEDKTKNALQNLQNYQKSENTITTLITDANGLTKEVAIVAELVPATDEEGNPIYKSYTDEDGNIVYEYEYETDENGNLVTDESGNPKVKYENGEPVKVQQMKVVYKEAELKTAVEERDEGLKNASENIDKANNSSSESEAREAAGKIASDLKQAKDSIEESARLLEIANQNYEAADTNYTNAQKKLDDAEEELKKQEGYLTGAIKDSNAAYAAVKAAQDKVDAIIEEVGAAYDEKDAAELDKIEKLYNVFQEKQDYYNAGELTKALIMYYTTRQDDYKEGFSISGGIEGYDIAKDLFGYSKTVVDGYSSDEGEDGNGNPFNTLTGKTTTYDFPDDTYDGKSYSYKKINGKTTGWVASNDDTNNAVVVRYTNKEGKTQEKYYNVKIDYKGGLTFYERTIEVVDDEENSVEAVAGRKEGYYVVDENGVPTGSALDLDRTDVMILTDKTNNAKIVVGAETSEVDNKVIPSTYVKHSRIPTVKYKLDDDGNVVKEVYNDYYENVQTVTRETDKSDAVPSGQYQNKTKAEGAMPDVIKNKTIELKKAIMRQYGQYTGIGNEKIYNLGEFTKDGVTYRFSVSNNVRPQRVENGHYNTILVGNVTVTLSKVENTQEWHYNTLESVTKCEKTVYQHQDAVVGNNAVILKKIVWDEDKINDGTKKDASIVVQHISLKSALAELNEAKDKVDKAEAFVKGIKEKIEALKQQTVDRTTLNQYQTELAKAKSALEFAQADLNEKEQEYELLSGMEIDLSRFDRRPSDDDDDDVTGTPGEYAGLPGSSADVITLTPVGGYDDELTAGGAGRGGRRGGNGAQDRGVAGVRVDDNNGANKNTNPVVVKKTNDDDKDNGAQKLTKVETPEKPLAATPFKEDPVNPAIVGISIAALLAVLAGLYYEYNRRKKAKAEEMKKYKKN